MAVATWSSSAALVKAVVLPLILVLLAVAAGASGTEDGPAVAKSGGRFSGTPLGRKLLTTNGTLPINLCGLGSAPDYGCKTILPLANNASCCPDSLGLTQSCWDVGLYYFDKCGSCNTTCKAGEVCCKGVCANLTTDKNNCGVCGNVCKGTVRCKYSFCGY